MPKGKTGNPRGRPPGAVGQGKSLRLYQDAAAHALWSLTQAGEMRGLVKTPTEAALLANKIVRSDAKCWEEVTNVVCKVVVQAGAPGHLEPLNETKNTAQRLTGSAKINGNPLAYPAPQADWLGASVYLLEVILRAKTRGTAAVSAQLLMRDLNWPRVVVERFFTIAGQLHAGSNSYNDVAGLDDVAPVFRLPQLVGGD